MQFPEERGRSSRSARLPPIAALVVRSWGIGAVIGAAFAVLLILTNSGGLHDLISQSRDGFIAIALLVFGFATLIAGLYSGAAVMLLSPEDE